MKYRNRLLTAHYKAAMRRRNKARGLTANVAPNPLRRDPTRTTMLRKSFEKEVAKRFNAFKVELIDLLLREDAFGIKSQQQVNPLVANFDPRQPRDKGGRWATVGAKALGTFKAVAGKIQHVEHIAKDFTVDKIGKAVAKLPERGQAIVHGSFAAVRTATIAAFASWKAGQAFAERVAKERGYSDEEARRLRGVLSSLDIAALKPIQIGVGATAPHLALPVSFVPPATAAYLAYSTARNPMATARAATGLVRGAIARVSKPFKDMADILGGTSTWNEEADSLGFVKLVAGALEVHQFDDWYIALLSASIDYMGDVLKGITLATEVYDDVPQDPSNDQTDDADYWFGSSVTENVAVVEIVENMRWAYKPDAEKVKAFEEWLRSRIGRHLTDEQLWKKYINDGYKKGLGRGYDDTKRRKPSNKSPDYLQGERTQFINGLGSGTVGVEKLKLLVSQSFTDLKGVTEELSTRMLRMLADGLVQNKTPEAIANDMIHHLGIGENRAKLVASQTLLKVHAEAQLDAMEQLGVEELGVSVEWVTGNKPCPKCKPLAGIILSPAKARGLLPRHVRCQCAFVPAFDDVREPGQKRTQKQIDKAFERSTKDRSPSDRWGMGLNNATREFSTLLVANKNKGGNCGTGAGGFKAGNTCARGDGRANTKGLSKSKAKFVGTKAGGHLIKFAEDSEKIAASKLGAKTQQQVYSEYNREFALLKRKTGKPVQVNKAPFDIRIGNSKAESAHVEFKTLSVRSNDKISVHPGALYRKVRFMEAIAEVAGKNKPGNNFHTVVWDRRNEYKDESGNKFDHLYSGHSLYYKRGNGEGYNLQNMHKVSSWSELKKLIAMEDKHLPPMARGSLPPPPPIEHLKKRAEADDKARLKRDRPRKARARAEGRL